MHKLTSAVSSRE